MRTLSDIGTVHDTDVLILGAGASGCGAALHAIKSGVRVLLADKGKLESCGSLGGGNDHYMAVMNTGAPGDDTESIVNFYCTPTSGLSPSQIRQWVEVMPLFIELLKQLGIVFEYNEDGSFYRTTGFGQPGSWWTHINNGKYIKRRLGRYIRSKGVDVLEYFQCTKILVENGRAVGAIGFHVLDGSFHIIRARAVVTALGRTNCRSTVNSSLLPFNAAFSPYITGSQIALGYEAGAQVITLDTEQEATLIPKGWGCPGMNGISSSGAKAMNALDDRYMRRYHP
ncbi:MAG: FAD-dependent oxidoreductase, partial [Mailhella sp.]